MQLNSIVNHKNFIFATRDSGYKSFSSAVAELVDNSIEANANKVDIYVTESGQTKRVIVADNGIGMNRKVLKIAFQFGGTTRQNSRTGSGRYGMGLPNSSLSQARRFDVYSWQSKSKVLWSYLDIDEVLSDSVDVLHEPTKYKNDDLEINGYIKGMHGTIVCWNKCDRLGNIKTFKLIKELKHELSRIFRAKIKNGVTIKINGEITPVFDPLYLDSDINNIFATQYGEEINYDIGIGESNNGRSSIVKVRFSELPIEDWSSLTNAEKRKHKITQRAGCTILRTGREIDYGWFFMGTKRRENYDDWWRCEIAFEPDLDELFGVTHTKQSINPTEIIKEILTPDIENIARILNRRVRDHFIKLKAKENAQIQKIVEKNDYLIEKPSVSRTSNTNKVFPVIYQKNSEFTNVKYKLNYIDLSSEHLFTIDYSRNELTININKKHLIFEKFLDQINTRSTENKNLSFFLELLISSMSRAYINLDSSRNRKTISIYNLGWSNILTSLLQ